MSVRTMARVWDESQHGGTELLMLLAIADFADDDGYAYPSVGKLAAKCRMSSRNVNFILSALRTTGELEVQPNQGMNGTNRYRVVTGLKPASPLKTPSPPEVGFTPEGRFTLKRTSATPEAGFPKPLKPALDKPSMNHQEPSVDATGVAQLRTCPIPEVVALYHDHLPELPRVRLLDSKPRQSALRAFWVWVVTSKRPNGQPRATTREEALAWIGEYFDRVRGNDFLMGRAGRAGSHANWKCNLDYLLTDRGRRQVIEMTEVSA